MKKALSLILSLALVLSLGLTALAATEVDVSAGNLGRGASLVPYGQTIKENDDGTVTAISTEIISYYLPEGEAIAPGATVTAHVTGTSDGDFRMWPIDVNETTNIANDDIFKASDHGFTGGDFDFTFTFTTLADNDPSTEFAFKAFEYGAELDNLVVKSLTLTEGGETAAPADDAAVEDTVDASPQTGETSYAILFLVLMVISMTGVVVLRKNPLVNK